MIRVGGGGLRPPEPVAGGFGNPPRVPDKIVRPRGAWAAALLIAVAPARAADELSGADKLRVLYSAEFRFTPDGLPVVPVAIAESLSGVTLSASGGLRLLPEGDGGPEVRAPQDEAWQVRAEKTTPAKLRFWSIVWRGGGGQSAPAVEEVRRWKERGEKARTFEQGTLFGVAGEVLDRRETLVAVGPVASFEEAEKASERLAKKAALAATGVYTELVDRPHGQLEAVGLKSGVRVRNEGVLWFAASGDAPLRVEGQGTGARPPGTYYGKVYVTLDRRGTLAVVNAVPEDRLLAGLVPAEIFPGAPDEALKAQAVAARGELLTKIGTRHAGDPYRLCSQTHCQVYSGAGRETPRTTAAVTATRGEVLFTADGKDLADTVYSANCGGHTEHDENVWPDMPPYPTLRGHRDGPTATSDSFAAGITAENVARFIAEPPRSWCGLAKLGAGERFRWTVTRSAADLTRLLATYKLGTVRSIEVLERGISGRARAIKITGSSRSETIRGELRIRQTFGGLRSSLFVVSVEDGAATFRGAGFGHGVGLCQTGAIGMAEAGKNYREILRHYYTGSVLRKLW
jgi:stage II sporulation protein D